MIGRSEEWHVDEGKDNLVKFTSEVVILTFYGITDQIDEYLYWQGERLFEENSQFHFEVNLNSLDSGNGKRDRDMRKVLNTEQWPYAIYEGTIADVEKIDSSVASYRVRTSGTMFIHGVEKKIDTDAVLSFQQKHINIRSTFAINLSDYDINAPFLAAFVKVSDRIQLEVDFYLKKVRE